MADLASALRIARLEAENRRQREANEKALAALRFIRERLSAERWDESDAWTELMAADTLHGENVITSAWRAIERAIAPPESKP